MTEVRLTPDGVAPLERAQAAETPVDDGNEIILKVSQELASMSLGFTVDAGGSVTKIVYRSKEDYENGKRKDADSSCGQLRLRYMSNQDGEAIFKFLHENCDIGDLSQLTGGGGGGGGVGGGAHSDDSYYWYHTGVGYQHYKHRIEQDLHIRTKIFSEADAFRLAIRGFYTRETSGNVFQSPLPLSPVAMDKALCTIRHMLTTVQSFKDSGDQSIGAAHDASSKHIDLVAYATKIHTIEGEQLASELSLTEIQYPCLIVLIGSTLTLTVVSGADKQHALADFGSISGKTFLSLGMALTGAKSFDELAEMAGRGDSRKVDVIAADHKNREGSDVDWYSLVSDDLVLFTLGKLADEEYAGTYSKEDIAAGLVQMFSAMITRLSIVHARINDVKSVIFTGSYLCHDVIRESMEESFHIPSLMLPFRGVEQFKMGILPNPGYLCALGTWQKNFELEQERERADKDESTV